MYNTLIVDDEIWMCEGLKTMMQKHCERFRVGGIAMNGRQALEAFDRGGFDLVITDIHMPQLDGLGLLKELRARDARLPVIIFTGHSEFQYAKTAIRHGVTDYLLKPLEPEELLGVLSRVQAELEARKHESAPPEAASAPDQLNSGKNTVQWLKELADTSYSQDLSLSGLADAAGFNISYMSRLFKAEIGVSFIQYLTEVRMRAAARLLRGSALQIAQIAKEVGYWDEKHFSKTFKREVGLSPAEYRMQPPKRENGDPAK